jgi:hypothetical protein
MRRLRLVIATEKAGLSYFRVDVSASRGSKERKKTAQNFVHVPIHRLVLSKPLSSASGHDFSFL